MTGYCYMRVRSLGGYRLPAKKKKKTSLSEVVNSDNSNIIYIKGDSACFFS